MASTRQLVLIHADFIEKPGTTLGMKREIIKALAPFNTAPDGSPLEPGVAYGPGLRMEMPMVGDKDEVNQILVTVLDEEFAWPVLERVCRGLHWALQDPDSGRTFSV